MTALLPNVLVFGFFIGGIANDRNPIWRMTVGRYWALEVFLFKVAAFSLVVYLAMKALRSVLISIRPDAADAVEESERQRAEQQREIEVAENKAYWARVEKLRSESKARFDALPESEKKRLFEATRRQREEDLRIAEARRLEEERVEQEKALDIERRRKLAASPEVKKKNAINDLIGGY